jgi:hypothetical protein
VNIEGDSKLLLGFPWPILFKPEEILIRLFTEFESATQKVLLSLESVVQNVNHLQQARLFQCISSLTSERRVQLCQLNLDQSHVHIP